MKINLRKLTKTLLFTTSVVSLTAGIAVNNSVADNVSSAENYVKSDFEIKLNAYTHFQAGYRKQNNLNGEDVNGKREKNVSNNRQDFAFYNDAAFTITAQKPVDDVKYGGKIVLVPTAKKKGSPSYNGTHIFVESSFGRVEMGSPLSAGNNMHTDAYSIVAATGDDWSRYADFTTNHMRQSDSIAGKTIDGANFDGNQLAPSFITYSEFFLDSKLVTQSDNSSFSNEPSRAVSYYTPKFKFGSGTKIQLGITYIPDSSNTGVGSATAASSGARTIKISLDGNEAFVIDSSVKDAFSGGICLEQNISDGVDFKLAVTGEHGKSAGNAVRKSATDALNGEKFKLKDLRSYNIGGIVNLGNFSIAGSYGSLGKSLTTAAYHKTGRETKYYSGAVAYKYGPFNTSVSYFKSDQYKNTVDAIALGADFKLAPGLKPYAEIATFTLKGKPEFFPELKKKKNKGTVAILGLKLSF